MSPTLPTRKLGKNGPEVAALGLGLMGISAFYGAPQPDSERLAFLDRAYELGATNWDSADIYADSEELIGKWFARTGKRDEIFLATKFAARREGQGMTAKRTVDSSPEYAKQACEKSLKRLGIKTIDLYYCHRVDKKTPIEKTVEAMVQLKKCAPQNSILLEHILTNLFLQRGQDQVPWTF
jgi:aryl-alcohol dehydrogenase-like predicted oxidoreductase